MSNENKEAAAAHEGAEQQTGQQPEAAESKATKAKSEAESGTSALRAVGLEACKCHRHTQVWVTSDGQAFPQEGDARAHARNLPSKEILKVTAE